MDGPCPRNLSPHKAIVHVQIITSVHPLMHTGECSGNAMSFEELKKYGVPPSTILSVSGMDMSECIKKLKPKLEEIKEMFNEQE
jgi:hypothetical protein